ncbi:hypothetical protein [Methylorubrum extorquens]|uniref:hypothetical protein n=1 Tax=Methylorubrum extorquens TaxID=408 RepID=UPI001EE6048F|nr:hypothetical protein [Methylorubrum extorquens]MCG5249657.1 hypothetical protein [Methylorubrum extorquens]
MNRMLPLAALALACVASPAFAAEVATVSDKPVLIPWGDWPVPLAVSQREPILTVILPIIAAYVIQAIRGLPVDVKETTVLTPILRSGGKLVIRQCLDYLRNCSAYVDRALFDSYTHRVILPTVRYERPP